MWHLVLYLSAAYCGSSPGRGWHSGGKWHGVVHSVRYSRGSLCLALDPLLPPPGSADVVYAECAEEDCGKLSRPRSPVRWTCRTFPVQRHWQSDRDFRSVFPVRVIIQPDSASASRRAAHFVADLVGKKPDCVLGMATGSTPLLLYQEMIRLHREEGLDFSQVKTFNLDEYVGLGPTHPQSYRFFMNQNLFSHINIDPNHTHVPDGRALDFEAHCRLY